MTKWTKFKELEEALKEMGVSLSPLGSPEPLPLIEMGQGRDLDELIPISGGGIYHIDPDTGQVTRLTFNICDTDMHWIERKITNAKDIIQKEDFNNSVLIETLHRYHFTYCRTLKEFHKENRQNRYYGSSLWTGYFRYSFIKSNATIKENKEQRLYPCKNCLENLSKKTNKKYNHETFNIKNAFKIPPPSLSITQQLECDYIPNIYSHDFPEISNQLKKEKNYTCEDCGKQYHDRRKLHCHHRNHLKHDNRFINLQILCKTCHAKKHSHMKNRQED